MSSIQEISLGTPGDYHVHLRDNNMKELVTPMVSSSGIKVCYVMPNLQPPLTDPRKVVEYKQSLTKIDPNTKFLMSLYLAPSTTPQTIKEAKQLGITGVKCYPAGVTTNSSHGVESYEPYFPVFAEMEAQDMVLNLHGECPSSDNVHVLNAESKFLPTLKLIHTKFPKLRIVLEHCTTAEAINLVKELGPSVAATITCHHLMLIVDNWAGNAFNFCKPVAKLPEDRRALIEAATSGNPKFFLGSDSAPHDREAKVGGTAAAGVFTSNNPLAYVAEVFSENNKLDKLRDFVSENGKKFYKVEGLTGDVKLVRKPHKVPAVYTHKDVELVPFLPERELQWQVKT